jgi:tetratricopeptide (TPR) repeat protein
MTTVRPPARLRRAALFAAALLAGPAGALTGGVALGHDFVRDSAPMRWVDQAMTEDLPPLKFPAYFEDFDKAKALVAAGRYKTALLVIRKIKDPKPEQVLPIALAKAKALGVTGRTEEALRTLTAPGVSVKLDAKDGSGAKDGNAARDVPLADHPRAQLLRAEILTETSRHDDALAVLKAHLAAYPDSWGGHFWTGEVSERVGDTEAAKREYGWFNDKPRELFSKWVSQVKVPEFDDAEKVTWLGRAQDRWATLTEAYRGNNALPKQVLNVFVKAKEIDAAWWPANLAAAEYFFGHDDLKQAWEELGVALKANPQDVRALRLAATLAMQRFDFNKADASVAALRKFDPASVSADLIEARNLLLQRQPKDAEGPVQRVLASQPRNMEALGLLAATYALQLQEDKTDEILAQVDAIDVGNDNASAYLEVAEQLGQLRQYPRSEAKYKKAIERAPWWTAAWNGLGLLYTQSGDEDKAYATLRKARELDPFNLETTNHLRLLDDMQSFKRVETDHFVFMYDAEKDPILAEYVPEFLESIHAQVAGEYRSEPPVKTYIEIFPSHEAFSVRTTGSPWIGTVGASTGRVIALVSPRKGGTNMEPFNWAQVLRHEYTHTVTLAATDNRIQHWMTEGLAVLEERTPMRWEWVPMLYQAVTKRELFTMENLTWGFVRPKKPTDRQLAYAQSYWVCKYVQETYGHDAILTMLKMFREAGRQEDVFPAVTGKPVDAFYQDFLKWCDKQVAGWGYDKETTETYDKLRAGAEAATKADPKKAIEQWEQVVKIRPVDAMPHLRLAGLYLLTKQPDKAIAHLDVLHQVEIKDNRFAKQIARVYKREDRHVEAARYALQAIYIDPYDMAAHELMRDACRGAGDAAGLAREERVIPVLTRWLEQRQREQGLIKETPAERKP